MRVLRWIFRFVVALTVGRSILCRYSDSAGQVRGLGESRARFNHRVVAPHLRRVKLKAQDFEDYGDTASHSVPGKVA